jgi:hypothetical protein
MESPFKKETTSYFSNEKAQQAFVHDTKDATSLLHKEISVNLAEQNLLLQRIRLMNELVNDIPSSDPQYSMILSQVQMDQIELDELKRRADSLVEQIKNLSI